MSRAILLSKSGRGWEVFVDVDAARRMVPSRVLHRPRVQAWTAGQIIPLVKTSSGKLDLVPNGRPHRFPTKGDAESAAHMIGNYLLELGSFVDTYTSTTSGVTARDRSRRRAHAHRRRSERSRRRSAW